MSTQTAPMGTAQPASPEERSGLNKVMWFGLIQIVGMVVGWVSVFFIFGLQFGTFSGLRNLPQNATQAQVSAALGPFFQNFSLLIPIDIAVGLVAAVVLTMGLRDMSRVDGSRFSVPWKLMIFLMIGSALAGVSVYLIFNDIPAIIAHAPRAPGTPSTDFYSVIGSLVLAGLVAVIGGILALIGLIGGQILGLWRVGSKYNETLLKLGAIFVIIPVLNIVAPFLVLIGAYQVKGRIDRPM
ncbi:MAG TPA: DUF973 family protein [Nitrososphaerales archaeon]|nr:DUF973 family protein [Nitrososphaerales archaeon]